jgi:manganese-dependent inorganic pyrophosphatase
MNSKPAKIVYVIGHKNPDTDSVCSAIGYAHFKNLTDKRFLFFPARAGKINEETQFVLERFGVPVPNEIESLAATVSDLELKRPISIRTNDSVKALVRLMRETGVRTVPVVDDKERLAGIAGLKDVARHYMESVGFSDLARAPIDLNILVRTLEGQVVSNSKKVEFLTGRVYIASMQKGTILNKVGPGDVVVIGDQHDIQIELIRNGCGALIVVDGMPVGSDVVRAAEAHGTLLLSSPHPAFATVQLMTMSEPVEAIMDAESPTVSLYTAI